MKDILSKLQEWHDQNVNTLRNVKSESSNELIALNNQINDAIKCLAFCQQYNIMPQDIKNIIVLPELNTGYSEYRILNDCESDKRELWQEVEIGNRKIRGNGGDLIIIRKL